MRSKKLLIALVAFLFLIVAIIVFVLLFKEKMSLASEEEIREIVEMEYKGSAIESINQQNKTYAIVLDHSLGEYELVIDGETRDILSLTLLTLHEQEDKTNGDTEQPEQPESPEPPPSMLTEEEAIEIALQEVDGKVDDVDLEEEDGITVYEIEIEVNDDDEAMIVINAYTGQILSVTMD